MEKLSNTDLNALTDVLLSYFPNFRDIDLIKHMRLFALENDINLKYDRTKSNVSIRDFVFGNLNDMTGKNQKTYLLEVSNIVTYTLDEFNVKTFTKIIETALKKLSSDNEIETRKEIDSILNAYPDVKSSWLKVYDFESSGDKLEALNRARLSLELLLKEILRNKKSLENQLPIIGAALDKRNVPKEFKNLMTQNINQYATIQNANSKHNAKADDWDDLEIQTILNQTWLLMKYFIAKLGGK